MTTYIYRYLSHILLCAFFVGLITVPFEASARHNDGGYSSATQRKIRNLDDDIVKHFAIPVLFGVRLSNIVSDFGDPRGNGTRLHEGQDIFAKKGTPIVSPTEAVVTRVGEGDSAGLYVYTANPGGESFRYMHLDSIADIKSGDSLNVGDYIGTVGDSGNAQGTSPHLHFEVREGEAKDPYERITIEFTLEEKMEFVVSMFKDLDDEDDMAAFLVEEYTPEFTQALNARYELPEEVIDSLKKKGIVSTKDLQEKLTAIIKSIPTAVTTNFALGAEGAGVSLIQFYLIYENAGTQAQALRVAGATGYFGPLTQRAIIEYQAKHDLTQTGVYDTQTRAQMAR